MSKTEREFKAFRIQKRYIKMIHQIIAHQNSLPEFKEANLEIGERQVVEDAIEHYHAQIFGEEVMSHVMPQLIEGLSNNIDLKFDRFIENMAAVLNNMYLVENINKELIGMLVQHAGFNYDILETEGEQVMSDIMDANKDIVDILTKLLIEKEGLDK